MVLEFSNLMWGKGFLYIENNSKKHTVVFPKTSRRIFENVQCFFKNVQCFFQNNGMFFWELASITNDLIVNTLTQTD